MKTSDKLFVISTIYLPIMLIAMFYPQIHDFYTYSVPLNDFVIDKWAYATNPEIFSKIQNEDGSTCFTTPLKHLFCYGAPRMFQSGTGGVSYVTSSIGIDGELHFERTDNEKSYFTMKNISRINGDTAKITFADKNYRMGNKDRTKYHIADKFEFATIVKKYDTFITNCDNYEGTDANLVQYLGIKTIDGVDYFVTWHTLVSSEKGIACDYPQIIKASLNHDFGI